MLKGLRHFGESFESFLKIDKTLDAATRARARMVYGMGLIFLTVQLLNMISMAVVYGGWTPQHNISVFSCIVFTCLTVAVRFTKSPVFFGLAYSVLALSSIGVAASIETIPGVPPYGINTALLPVLCASAAFIAFVGTRLISTLYILSSLVLIGIMYKITAASGIVFRNLSQLESAVSRAQTAERARGEFLATMSHEIRTPLHGILGLSDMLAQSDLPETQGRYAHLITVSANSLMEIIDEVLDMARLEDGTVRTIAEPFTPRELLQDVSDLFGVKASEKNLWIGIDIGPGIPEQLIGDAPHLRQVLNNLVGNALKFTQLGGVRIGARLVGIRDGLAGVQFYVQDSGVGISDDEKGTVFERFKQTASAKTTTAKGTGLGLSICRELTEMMGGTLELHSTPGKGTVFYFTLALPMIDDTTVSAEIGEPRHAA
jgi:signal transduction histidine kinase